MDINPISKGGTTRLVRRAIDYALDRGRRSETLVHQGNIMKYTEGAFCQWGYQLAREEFADRVITEEEVYEKHGGKLPEGKILIKDRIAGHPAGHQRRDSHLRSRASDGRGDQGEVLGVREGDR